MLETRCYLFTGSGGVALTKHVEANVEVGGRRRRAVLTATRVNIAAQLRPQLFHDHHAPRVPQCTGLRDAGRRRRWRHDDVIAKPRDGRRRLGVATPAGQRYRLLRRADADHRIVVVAVDVRARRRHWSHTTLVRHHRRIQKRINKQHLTVKYSTGATVNAGVENEIRSKCKDGKCRSVKIGCRSQGRKIPEYRIAVWSAEPILYSKRALSYFLEIVLRLLSE